MRKSQNSHNTYITPFGLFHFSYELVTLHVFMYQEHFIINKITKYL